MFRVQNSQKNFDTLQAMDEKFQKCFSTYLYWTKYTGINMNYSDAAKVHLLYKMVLTYLVFRVQRHTKVYKNITCYD